MANAGRITLLSVGLMMSLTACTSNYDSNPLKNYPLLANKRQVDSPDDIQKMEAQKEIIYVEKEVAKEVIKYVPKEVEKNFVAAQLFQIQNLDPVSYIAGTESQVRFEVRVLQGAAKFSAAVEGLSGATLKEISNEGNKKIYGLIFKPSVNSIQNGSQEETRNLKIRLNLQSLVHEDKEKEAVINQAFSTVDKSKSFEMTLRRNRSNPKIEQIEMPEVVGEGESVPVRVTVSAPGTYEGFQPQLVMTYDFGGFTADGMIENNGTTFLRESTSRAKVEFVSEGKWIYNLEIDAKAKGLIPPQLNNKFEVVATDAVLLKANMAVWSPNGTTSDKKTVKFKISVNRSAVATQGNTGL